MKETVLQSIWSSAWILFLAGSLACQSALPARMSGDLERLQGDWKGRGPGGECWVTISGNSLLFEARSDFWFETTFTLPPGAEHPQLHATITGSPPGQAEVGTVVVALFKVEGDSLSLGVLEDFEEPPTGPIASEWEDTIDRYDLARIPSPDPGGEP